MAKRITIDPVTRIEGHLRIECEVEGGKVTNAWSSGQMWRGDRDHPEGAGPAGRLGVHPAYLRRLNDRPRTGFSAFGRKRPRAGDPAQRPVHPQPDDGRARGARPHRALLPPAGAGLGRHRLGGHQGRPEGRRGDRREALALEAQHGRGDQGLAGPAQGLRRLRPAGHLRQRLLGPPGDEAAAGRQPAGRAPLPAGAALPAQDQHGGQPSSAARPRTCRTLAVGGVTNPINPDAPDALNMERLYYVKTLHRRGPATSSRRPCSSGRRGGRRALRRLASRRSARASRTTSRRRTCRWTPRARVRAARRLHPGTATSRSSRRSRASRTSSSGTNVKESIKHSWYNGDWNKHPYEESTDPKYTDWKESVTRGRSTPGSSPRPSRASPPRSARSPTCCACSPPATSRPRSTRRRCSNMVSSVAKTKVGLAALHSTIGRIAARVDPLRGAQRHAAGPVRGADGEHRQGRHRDLQPADLPEGRAARLRLPRGAARHPLALDRDPGRQDQELPGVVPSTWNACPRNGRMCPGPTRRRWSATRWPTRKSRWRSSARSTPSTPAWPAPSTWSTRTREGNRQGEGPVSGSTIRSHKALLPPLRRRRAFLLSRRYECRNQRSR